MNQTAAFLGSVRSSNGRSASRPLPDGITRLDVDRNELKRHRAACDDLDRRRREVQDAMTGAEAAIDEAVASHQRTAAAIHASLDATTDAGERLLLRAQLNEANELLDATCTKLRARIAGLQPEAMALAQEVGARGRVERQLLQSASIQLQLEYWRAGQNLQWAQSRQAAARRSLEIAQGGDAALWQYECDLATEEREAAAVEQETLREELLSE